MIIIFNNRFICYAFLINLVYVFIMKRSLYLMSALALTIGTTTLTTAAPFQLKSEKQNVELKSTPKNIAVYDLSILDTLNALNIEAAIVPTSSYAGSLSKYQQDKFVKAGSLFEPDLEQLKNLKPDLIFVGGRSAKTAETLTSIAPTLDLSANTDNYIPDLEARTNLLAKAFKREKIAKQKINEIKKAQAELKTKTQGKTAIMLFAVGENFMSHAENDRFGFVYDLAGFKSVLPLSEKTDAPRPEAGSPEAIALAQKNAEILQKAIDANPDYIIVLDRGAVNTQKYTALDNIQKHPILKNAQAVKTGKVIQVNADAWYLTGAGLDNTAFMLKELSNAIK
jgi:iron complex transport system substrate-binding protein